MGAERKVAVMVGSLSDLKQCLAGLATLRDASDHGTIELLGNMILVSSIHRATEVTLQQIRTYHELEQPPDVLIAGAGWANHLTGMCDAYLRYALQDTKIVVVGVAFEDPSNEFHTMAARLSITEVPGNQVVFSDGQSNFIGANGFLRACRFAISGQLPVITLPDPRPPKALTLDKAIEIATMSEYE